MSDIRLTLDELAPIIEMSEAEAWADMLLAAPPALAKEYGIRLDRLSTAAVGIVARVDTAILNRTLGLGVLEPATEALVDAVLKDYSSTNIKHFTLQVSPHAEPQAIFGWLSASNLVIQGNTAQVFRDDKPPAEAKTNLSIQKIGVEYSGAFAEIACSIYGIPAQLQPWFIALVGRPRWHHYLAFEGNHPVAAAALFVDGNVGWTGFAGTLDRYRQRGAQNALLAQRIRDGITMGCDWFVSTCEEETPDHPSPSFHNLLRHGFKLAYLRPRYGQRAAV